LSIFSSTIKYCALFFFGLQILYSPAIVQANESFNIESIANGEDINIDTFIDLGFEYQQRTGKRFKAKDFLKKAYAQLRKEGITVDKATKKEIKEKVYARIAERLFVAKGATNTNARSRDFGEQEFSDRYRRSVFYTCCGILMCAIPCPVIQLAGGYIVTKNIDVIWNETERYLEEKRVERAQRIHENNRERKD
jgi:hypothetical protein